MRIMNYLSLLFHFTLPLMRGHLITELNVRTKPFRSFAIIPREHTVPGALQKAAYINVNATYINRRLSRVPD